MADIIRDRVADISTSTGNGDFTLANSPPTGYRTLDDVAVSGDTFKYTLSHQTLAEWETGRGRYSGSNVFVREVILGSSNSGSVVSFSAGTKDFFITNAARDISMSRAIATFGGI